MLEPEGEEGEQHQDPGQAHQGEPQLLQLAVLTLLQLAAQHQDGLLEAADVVAQLLLHLLLLLEHAAGVFQLLRIAGDQTGQLGLGGFPLIDGRRLFPQGRDIILVLAEQPEQRQGLQLTDLLAQGIELKLQGAQQALVLLSHQVFAQLGQLGDLGGHAGRQRQVLIPLRVLGGEGVAAELAQVAEQFTLGVLQQLLTIASQLAGCQIVSRQPFMQALQGLGALRGELGRQLGQQALGLLQRASGLAEAAGIAGEQVFADLALRLLGDSLAQLFVGLALRALTDVLVPAQIEASAQD